MLAESRARIEALSTELRVLDVGGWASPLERADEVVDLMPYATRGLYGHTDPARERFSESSWHQLDICAREPWPFADGEFDFAVCSHTLEDVRDPVWVCSEINRVSQAGYIEVPARVEEQTPGVHGPWVGWSHHHWLVDIDDSGVQFVLKPHLIHGRSEFWVDLEWTAALAPADRVSTYFWEDSFDFAERIFYEPEELHAYLRAAVPNGAGADHAGSDSRIGPLRRAAARAGLPLLSSRGPWSCRSRSRK